MDNCPVCGARAIGKVGIDQYFCWDCCIEFMLKGQDLKIFYVEADGSLISYDDYLQSTANL
ncbi:MAG: hypothetical protein H6Q73_543 [Firmicutes bacterium]|nr:hypothetical protein [Bacillota bacterium]